MTPGGEAFSPSETHRIKLGPLQLDTGRNGDMGLEDGRCPKSVRINGKLVLWKRTGLGARKPGVRSFLSNLEQVGAAQLVPTQHARKMATTLICVKRKWIPRVKEIWTEAYSWAIQFQR